MKYIIIQEGKRLVYINSQPSSYSTSMKNSSLLISALCFACITAVGKGLPVIKNEKQERIVSPMEMNDDEAATNKQFNGQMFANWDNVNRSDHKTDSLPEQQKKRDFNTTRSNRQNSNYQAGIVTNNGNPTSKDSIPKKMEAQDFNTTRSNRQNSNYQAGIVTHGGNSTSKDSIPKKMEAQDFNTTRSNRQNSNYQAGRGTHNGNPTSKDSIPKKMEAQDFNTPRS
ncbi:MAG: hypothetical protein IT250_16875, partial [Chitinophagaceae bacterium]|nr:hypothetical protein [Chitinophagaceae bacterium]